MLHVVWQGRYKVNPRLIFSDLLVKRSTVSTMATKNGRHNCDADKQAKVHTYPIRPEKHPQKNGARLKLLKMVPIPS